MLPAMLAAKTPQSKSIELLNGPTRSFFQRLAPKVNLEGGKSGALTAGAKDRPRIRSKRRGRKEAQRETVGKLGEMSAYEVGAVLFAFGDSRFWFFDF